MDNINQKNTLSFKDCGASELGRFITALEKSSIYERKMYQPISEKVHFERFNYQEGNSKISVVYDTKARILSITAKEETLKKLKDIYDGKSVTPVINNDAQVNKPQINKINKTQPQKAVPPNQNKTKLPQGVVSQNQGNKPIINQNKNRPNINNKKQTPPIKNEVKKTNENDNISLEYKNGFSLKNYSQEAFDAAIKQIKEFKGLYVKKEPEVNNNGITIQAFKIEDKKKQQKLFVRYLPSKNNVQMQGKQSALYHDIQMLLFKGTDFKTAITTYIKQTGEEKKASTLEKQLKKLIPNAYDYLSNQAKQYLTIAFMDINNEETRLSDYSALMVSPYRGLERLIYDLQIAKNIEVKMIGQAYEKISEGKYCLKQGYKRRIQSVVYNEVMSELYQEYFEKRNFYLHSDNSVNSQMRVITNKEEAKKIYFNLLEIINYNYKKLQEINFSFKE